MSKKTNVISMLNSFIPISALNQGKATKIIQSLGHDDIKIVIKNNEPMAAIVPISRYSELIEMEEKLLSKEDK